LFDIFFDFQVEMNEGLGFLNDQHENKLNKLTGMFEVMSPEFYSHVSIGVFDPQVMGCEVASLSAIATHVDQTLPPPDNVSALL
jgi:hypothetical protein